MSNLVHASQIKDQIKVVHQVVKEVMKKDEHYGVIPGTNKYTLFQTGAQKLLATFRLGSEPEVINTDETDTSVSYRVRVRLFNIADGNTVGYGMGECSSLEEKYAWRKAATSKEWEATPEKSRRIKYGQGQYGEYETQQVRMNYKDVANTILKMATKRALIQATLTATAAGDIFTQDLDDMDPLVVDALTADPKTGEVKSRAPIASVEDIKKAVSALTYQTNGNETKNLFLREEQRADKRVLVVIGKTFNHSALLKQMGFVYHKSQGAQYGETYLDITNLETHQSQQSQSPKPPKSSQSQLAKLATRVEMYGYEVSAPVQSGKSFWVQATSLDEHGDQDSLKAEGFILHNNKWVMNVTHLVA